MNRMIPIIVAVLAIVAGGAWFLTQGGDEPQSNQTQVTSSGEVDTTTDTSGVVEMVMGDLNAPVELIEYASFTCPHCASFHEAVLKPLKADYVETGKVKVVFRDVYFDRVGLWASMVARCGGPEKYFGIVDLLYKGQSDWAKLGSATEIVDEFRKIGRLAGIEDEKLEACLQDGEMAQALVAWYQENATEHDITSTPSFVIDGEKVKNQSYDGFSALFDSKLGG